MASAETALVCGLKVHVGCQDRLCVNSGADETLAHSESRYVSEALPHSSENFLKYLIELRKKRYWFILCHNFLNLSNTTTTSLKEALFVPIDFYKTRFHNILSITYLCLKALFLEKI